MSKQLNILLLDEIKDIESLFLSSNHFNIDLAFNANEAIFRINNGIEKYDVVLINTKKSNSQVIEFIEKVKKYDKDFLIMTIIEKNDENIIKFLELGINEFFLKPLDNEKLLKVLNKHYKSILNVEQEKILEKTHTFLIKHNLITNEFTSSNSVFKLFGLKPVKNPTLEYFSSVIYKNDINLLVNYIKNKESHSIDLRVVTQQNEFKVFNINAELNINSENQEEMLVIGTENTQKYLKQEKEKEFQASISKVQQMAKIGFWHSNYNTNEHIFSPNFIDIFELNTLHDFSPIKWIEMIHEEDRQRVLSLHTDIVENGIHKVTNVRYKIVTAKNNIKHIETNWTYEINQNNEIVGTDGVIKDITQQVLTEEKETQFNKKLAASEEKLQMFIKHSPAAVAMFDNNMNYIIASDGWYKEYKIEKQDIIGKNHYEISPEIPKSWIEIHKKGLQGEIIKSSEDKFIREDGSVQYVRWEVHPWHDLNGQIGGIIIYTTDVTDYITLEQEIQSQKEALIAKNDKLQKVITLTQNIIDNAPVRIFWKDINGVYLGANKLFLKDAKLESQDQIIGKTDYDMVWKNIAHLYIEDDKKVMDSKTPILLYEEPQIYEDGSTIYLLTSKIPLIDNNGNVYGILGVYNDITKQKEQETLLLEQTKLAAMGEMIGNIAHQWRQPLSVIATSATGILMEKKQGSLNDEEIERLCKYINENTQYLSQTIDTFRDFIKGENTKESILVEELLDLSISIVDGSFKNNYIKLINNKDTIVGKNLKVTISKNEFSQVIINILNNAKDIIKQNNTTNAWVKINYEIIKNKLIISIEDNGGGIPEIVLPHIFEPYFTTKHKAQGTGLGLHMAYKIVKNSIHGNIYAKNSENGAVFYIEIPLD